MLQHARTQLYLRSLGNWTDRVIVAHDFRESQSAREFARQYALKGVRVVVLNVSVRAEESTAFALVAK